MNSALELLLAKAGELRDDAPAPSPCNSVCRLDARTGLCEGCFRTLEEIADWSRLAEPRKRAVWRAIVRRAQGLP